MNRLFNRRLAALAACSAFVLLQQIWTGEATKTMDPSNDPQKHQQRLQKAVAKLLKNFPPRAK